MSSDRTHVGKLFLITKGKEEIEAFAKGVLCGELNSEYYSTYTEELIEHYYYIVVKDCLFKLVDTELDDDYGCHIEKVSDEEFNYHCHYYDGATGLQEELIEELEKII